MHFVNSFSQLQLDIVGIVAVLGEGSTARNAQASALSWHHILPRLLPAPQALLRHEQEKRLPTQKGTVVGAYSGNTRFELNFFSQLLHPDKLHKFEVELVEVKKKKKKAITKDKPAYNVKQYGYLAALSVLGFLMAIALFALSIVYDDGFALCATILLSFTSTTVGFASWWRLDFEEEIPKPGREIPDGDLVIYYPRQGAFRVVRCDEIVSRLYFKAETCENLFDDDWYRITALISAVFLLAGLLCLGNSRPIMQLAFAASYILLNVLHWGSSALNPLTHHWEHNYDVNIMNFNPPIRNESKGTSPDNTRSATFLGNVPVIAVTTPRSPIEPRSPDDYDLERMAIRKRSTVTFLEDTTKEASRDKQEVDVQVRSRPKLPHSVSTFSLNRRNTQLAARPEVPKEVANYTSALWTAIALTGSVRWLRNSHIVPDNEVWDKWVTEAGKRVVPKFNHKERMIPTWWYDENNVVNLPLWDYQDRLGQLFREADLEMKKRPSLPNPVIKWTHMNFSLFMIVKLRKWKKRATHRVEEKLANKGAK